MYDLQFILVSCVILYYIDYYKVWHTMYERVIYVNLHIDSLYSQMITF